MSLMSDAAKRTKGVPAEVACTGKVGFADYSLAAQVVARNRNKERSGRTAYKCAHCGLYHVGSDNGQVQRSKAIAFQQLKRAAI